MKKVGFESEKVFIVSIRLRCSNKLFSRPEKEFFFVVNNNSRRIFWLNLVVVYTCCCTGHER